MKNKNGGNDVDNDTAWKDNKKQDTYHHIQLAHYATRLDDPVDRLGALKQQDNVAVQESVILQRLQLHNDVHLEGAAKKDESSSWILSQQCNCDMRGLFLVTMPTQLWPAN